MRWGAMVVVAAVAACAPVPIKEMDRMAKTVMKVMGESVCYRYEARLKMLSGARAETWREMW